MRGRRPPSLRTARITTCPFNASVRGQARRTSEQEIGHHDAHFTVKQLARLPLCPSELVTVAVRAPRVAVLAILNVTLSWVGLVTVSDVTVMPAPNVAVAP